MTIPQPATVPAVAAEIVTLNQKASTPRPAKIPQPATVAAVDAEIVTLNQHPAEQANPGSTGSPAVVEDSRVDKGPTVELSAYSAGFAEFRKRPNSKKNDANMKAMEKNTKALLAELEKKKQEIVALHETEASAMTQAIAKSGKSSSKVCQNASCIVFGHALSFASNVSHLIQKKKGNGVGNKVCPTSFLLFWILFCLLAF